MSLDDIELKLKYKRDGNNRQIVCLMIVGEFSLEIALTKKRQTPVQSLTKDERIAMAEREN